MGNAGSVEAGAGGAGGAGGGAGGVGAGQRVTGQQQLWRRQ